MSCVLRIGNARQVALLVGDIEQPQEARLVLGPAGLRADVLLVPHHGSKTSSSPAFLDAVQPRIAIVQAGYRNRFGHPAAPVMQRYRQRQVRIVQSPQCGAAWWRSAQPELVQCQRTLALRYWNHDVE
jgi:competence protein ComEC